MKFRRDFFAGLAIAATMLTLIGVIVVLFISSEWDSSGEPLDVIKNAWKAVWHIVRAGGLVAVFSLFLYGWSESSLKAERHHQEIMQALRAIHAQRTRRNKLE